MSINIVLRKATIKDIPLLKHWDEQAHVIASDPNDDWEWDTEIPREVLWREQLIAEENGRPIGFLQIIDPQQEESHYWGSAVAAHLRAIDIWIGDKEDLGKGYGSAMMRLAIARCFAEEKVQAILIDPLATNTRAHTFYQRLGFEFVAQRKFGDDECFVFQLTREKNDEDDLAS